MGEKLKGSYDIEQNEVLDRDRKDFLAKLQAFLSDNLSTDVDESGLTDEEARELWKIFINQIDSSPENMPDDSLEAILEIQKELADLSAQFTSDELSKKVTTSHPGGRLILALLQTPDYVDAFSRDVVPLFKNKLGLRHCISLLSTGRSTDLFVHLFSLPLSLRTIYSVIRSLAVRSDEEPDQDLVTGMCYGFQQFEFGVSEIDETVLKKLQHLGNYIQKQGIVAYTDFFTGPLTQYTDLFSSIMELETFILHDYYLAPDKDRYAMYIGLLDGGSTRVAYDFYHTNAYDIADSMVLANFHETFHQLNARYFHWDKQTLFEKIETYKSTASANVEHRLIEDGCNMEPGTIRSLLDLVPEKDEDLYQDELYNIFLVDPAFTKNYVSTIGQLLLTYSNLKVNDFLGDEYDSGVDDWAGLSLLESLASLYAQGVKPEKAQYYLSFLESHPFVAYLVLSQTTYRGGGPFVEQYLTHIDAYKDMPKELIMMVLSSKNQYMDSYLAFDLFKLYGDVESISDEVGKEICDAYSFGAIMTIMPLKTTLSRQLLRRFGRTSYVLRDKPKDRIEENGYLQAAKFIGAGNMMYSDLSSVTDSFMDTGVYNLQTLSSGMGVIVDDWEGPGNYLCSHVGTSIMNYVNNKTIEAGGFIHCPYTQENYVQDYTELVGGICRGVLDHMKDGEEKTVMFTCFPKFATLESNTTAEYFCGEGADISNESFGLKTNDIVLNRVSQLGAHLGARKVKPYRVDGKKVGYTLLFPKNDNRKLHILVAKLPVDNDLSPAETVGNPSGDGAGEVLSTIISDYSPHIVVGFGVYPYENKDGGRDSIESRSFTVETLYTGLAPEYGRVEYSGSSYGKNSSLLPYLKSN